MKFSIGDEVCFAIPKDQVGSFNPSKDCADGEWSGVMYVSDMKTYINMSGVVVEHDFKFGSHMVKFADYGLEDLLVRIRGGKY